MSTRKFYLFYASMRQYIPSLEHTMTWIRALRYCKSACALAKYAPFQDTRTWMYHKEEIIRTLCYMNRNWSLIRVGLSGWKESVTCGLGADISLPQCLATGIWNLAESDHRAEISGNIVWYDALAPRPAVLVYWYLAGACAISLQLKVLPYSWEKVSAYGMNQIAEVDIGITRASLLPREQLFEFAI